MIERPGQRRVGHGLLGTAVSTAIRGNATAFGFSITITGSFGALQSLAGTPTVVDVLLFGVAAAATIGLVEAAVTRGFRARPGTAPPEVRILATAQDVISVSAGIATAAGVGSLVGGAASWPLGSCAATLVFLVAETAETMIAELVQKGRGDPHAEEED